VSQEPFENHPKEVIENHRRVISITLALLDERLCNIEAWILGREEKGVLYKEENKLTGEQREEIRNEINAIRNILEELKSTLDLFPRTVDSTTTIRGACYAVMEPLCELDPKHLAGYGRPSDFMLSYFEPRRTEMLAHIEKVLQAVSRGNVSEKGGKHEPRT